MQFYVAPPKGLDLPKIQLRAFEKVELMPGETVEVTSEINIDELRFFDEAEQKMYVPRGDVYKRQIKARVIFGSELINFFG